VRLLSHRCAPGFPSGLANFWYESKKHLSHQEARWCQSVNISPQGEEVSHRSQLTLLRCGLVILGDAALVLICYRELQQILGSNVCQYQS